MKPNESQKARMAQEDNTDRFNGSYRLTLYIASH